MEKNLMFPSRAFYGWLTHVRHMRTVRASLGGLAFDDPIEAVDERWYEGVQEDWWHQNQMELILGGNGGGGGGGGGKESDARNTNVQGGCFRKANKFRTSKGSQGLSKNVVH